MKVTDLEKEYDLEGIYNDKMVVSYHTASYGKLYCVIEYAMNCRPIIEVVGLGYSTCFSNFDQSKNNMNGAKELIDNSFGCSSLIELGDDIDNLCEIIVLRYSRQKRANAGDFIMNLNLNFALEKIESWHKKIGRINNKDYIKDISLKVEKLEFVINNEGEGLLCQGRPLKENQVIRDFKDEVKSRAIDLLANDNKIRGMSSNGSDG